MRMKLIATQWTVTNREGKAKQWIAWWLMVNEQVYKTTGPHSSRSFAKQMKFQLLTILSFSKQLKWLFKTEWLHIKLSFIFMNSIETFLELIKKCGMMISFLIPKKLQNDSWSRTNWMIDDREAKIIANYSSSTLFHTKIKINEQNTILKIKSGNSSS